MDGSDGHRVLKRGNGCEMCRRCADLEETGFKLLCVLPQRGMILTSTTSAPDSLKQQLIKHPHHHHPLYVLEQHVSMSNADHKGGKHVILALKTHLRLMHKQMLLMQIVCFC